MKKPVAFPFALLLLISFSAHAGAESARGFVYHDRNGDGIRDADEPGIADVLVSNGREVVPTGTDGSYTLPVSDDTIVFVVQPKGWSVPLNVHNLPRFYYIHKPKGSRPDLEFAGVAPTGPLPASVDFPLLASGIGEKFSFFAFGDPQPYSIQDLDYFRRDIVEQAMEEVGPVAGVTLGDILGDDLDLFDPMKEVIRMMDRPWWHVYGNHDMNFDATSQEEADETYERHFGPPTYAFEIGNVVFLVLDNVLFPNDFSDSFYVGGFTGQQLTFVENLLAHIPPEKLVVTMMHIPLFDESYGDTFIDEDREAFFALFKNHRHTLSLSAHTHKQAHHFFDHDHDHWPHIDAPHHHYNVGTTSGSWWRGPLDERGIPETTMRDGTPNGYAILHFDDNTYTYDWRVAGAPKDEVMSIYLPRSVPFREGWSYALLAVNFYNGSEDATVEYRVGNGKWQTARHTVNVDPEYAYNRLSRDREAYPSAIKSLPYPELSTHLWTGRLPTHLEPGVHKVDVRITDRFGRIFTDHASYRIFKHGE